MRKCRIEKITKKIPPNIIRQTSSRESWIAGDKQYFLDVDGTIRIRKINSDADEVKSDFIFDHVTLKARTAAFGTIMETRNGLVGLIGQSKVNLANDIVCWRVFPRAKNYANQLHVVKDDRIEIVIIESIENNKFGFDTESISNDS